MTVRAKFEVTQIDRILSFKYPDKTKEGHANYSLPEEIEVQTIKMRPVGKDSEENKVFWDATPSGTLELQTINPKAWRYFELGQEFYIDFKPVPPPSLLGKPMTEVKESAFSPEGTD